MNVAKYPWLLDLSSEAAKEHILKACKDYDQKGAAVFHDFVSAECLASCAADAIAQEDFAFTTDNLHTAYLKPVDSESFSSDSVYNHEMRTQVASTAFDEISDESELAKLYRNPTMLNLVSLIVRKPLYLSEDPLGCCSINVFRPGYYHSFHFDESEFSTTLMLQDADTEGTGLFQYTHPLREKPSDLALSTVAATIDKYELRRQSKDPFKESSRNIEPPELHTLDFRPGTLSIFSGSRSLHRVTDVVGSRSRLVAVLTFATCPGFCNSVAVQKMFWGRSSSGGN